MKIVRWAIVETCHTPGKGLRWEGVLRRTDADDGTIKTFFDSRAEAMDAIAKMTDAEALKGWILDDFHYRKVEPGHYVLEPKGGLRKEGRQLTHYRLFPAECGWEKTV